MQGYKFASLTIQTIYWQRDHCSSCMDVLDKEITEECPSKLICTLILTVCKGKVSMNPQRAFYCSLTAYECMDSSLL